MTNASGTAERCGLAILSLLVAMLASNEAQAQDAAVAKSTDKGKVYFDTKQDGKDDTRVGQIHHGIRPPPPITIPKEPKGKKKP